VAGASLSRDGSTFVIRRGIDPLIDNSPLEELFLMSADGGEMRRLTNNGIQEQGPELSPDRSQVLFTAQANERMEYPYNSKLFVVSADGGPPRLLTPGAPYSVSRGAWSKDGEAIYFFAGMGVTTQIMRVDVASGEITQLTEGLHSGWGEYIHGRDEFLLTLSNPHNPGELYRLTATGGELERVSRWFDHLARDYKLPAVEVVDWKGEDGVTVEGILFYPLDYQPGQRYPLVIQTHGGPHAADQLRFPGYYDYVEVLAAKGYAVLKPNYRGSTGYGDEFMRDMVGSYFKNAHKDVLAGADYLIERGIADPDRLATMGWSAGGHMTNKLITYTDRFKAASSGAGASNWVSMYAQSDVRIYRTPWFGGTPWEEDAPIDVFWEHSPLKYVANVTTPTIFLFGEGDYRVPPQQGVEIFRALKSNGVPTHLYLAPREGHGFGELRHQLFKANVELDWFERYVTGRSYTWEEAPEAGEDDSSRPFAPEPK
jgi:dipeptidyl aminopeptidase/acylaminoacyl peptidase